MKSRKYHKYSDSQLLLIVIGNVVVWGAIIYVAIKIMKSL